MSKLDAAARNALSDADFAYIDSNGGRHLPINDAAHIRAAMARFNQTQFENPAAKDGARQKIMAAAKAAGIDAQAFSELILARQGADPMIPLSTVDDIIDAILGPDDNDEDDDPAQPTQPNQADEPGAGDVHVDAPVNSEGVPGKKRSPLLKKLMKGLRTRVASKRFLTAEDLETEYRSALGHAGGTARSAAEPADAAICPACQAAGHGAANGCMCPACQEGDPDDCECQALMDEDDDDVDPSAFGEDRHWFEIPSNDGPLRLFIEASQSFADAPGWINVLPKPGTYQHPTYGAIAISPERNAAFVRNFKDGVYQSRIPVDAEHESKLSGALGWITDTRQNPDGSVDAQMDWTDRGRTMLASDRFKYFSPEWYDSWTDPATAQAHSDVLIGGALTTRPFFKEGALRPLVASEHGIRVGDDPQLVPPLPGTGTTHHRPDGQENTTMTEAIQLTEDEIKRFREMDSELKSAREAATAAEAQATQATERAAALERENRRRSFAEQASPWHGETAAHVDFMEALPSDELRQQYAEQQTAQATALTEAQKEANLFRAVGSSGIPTSGAVDKINQAAAALRASEPKLTVEQARARAIEQNPQLYAEYEAEIAG